jgi:hypothetical protein
MASRPHGEKRTVPRVICPMAPARPSEACETYWRFAAERQAIFFRRIEGVVPLTADPFTRASRDNTAANGVEGDSSRDAQPLCPRSPFSFFQRKPLARTPGFGEDRRLSDCPSSESAIMAICNGGQTMPVTSTIFKSEKAPCGRVVDGEHYEDRDDEVLVSDNFYFTCGCRVIQHEYHDGSVSRKVVRHDGRVLVDEHRDEHQA